MGSDFNFGFGASSWNASADVKTRRSVTTKPASTGETSHSLALIGPDQVRFLVFDRFGTLKTKWNKTIPSAAALSDIRRLPW